MAMRLSAIRIVINLLGVACIARMSYSASKTSDVNNALSDKTEKYISEGRIFYSALGDILERIPFLPLTFNVPDIISSISGVFSYFTPGSPESTDEPRNILKLVRSAIDLTILDVEELDEDFLF